MDTDITGDAETDLPPPVSDDLDDNGFPILPPTAAATSSFADDFYRSGIDWSSLQLQAAPPHQRNPAAGTKAKCGGPLVQRSLFQAWGIEKPPREEAAQGVRAAAGVSSSSASHSGTWSGRKRRWGGDSEENGVAKKPATCPFYKKIPGTPFTVDAFRYGAVEGCSAYFLSHFHYDHYGGLTKKWCHGPIYCTALTARLVKMLLSINSEYICPLELNTEFPPQEDVIDFVVRTAQRYLKKQPKTLIVVGAYSIGKENVYLAISQALEVPIYTDASRRRILHSFGWPDLSKRISSCDQSSPLHVMPLASVQHEKLTKYLETLNQRFLAVLAFRPTGWTFSEAAGKELDLIKPSSRGRVTIYGVPYSEHSSFTELRDFLKRHDGT
ncbi:hypothetical protein BRADI_5g08550v3 [Brachypodium distachyon]|uniref:DNA repair metallo-beta-lactamase domain-containing protein n=1 Tax=Brachypodium distachyon TaxID=15368 RepID=A0A2K2CFZ4_BRADI|nr:hypothetical protein BRADI_5g08550v3 [Brachypodium distachyon]PNT60954.1 hypothetical protein BRADI_5g08550v3 [Brachypodium distachyon]